MLFDFVGRLFLFKLRVGLLIITGVLLLLMVIIILIGVWIMLLLLLVFVSWSVIEI